MQIAGRAGGGEWQRKYLSGDSEVLEVLSGHLAFLGALYALPEYEAPLTWRQLNETVAAAFGK